MKIPHDYVVSIQYGEIIINCVTKDKKKLLKQIGAKNKIFNRLTWRLSYNKNDERELANKLEKLRDFGFCFAGAVGGWPPSGVFDYLRDKGYANGKIIEIMWRAPNKEVKYER